MGGLKISDNILYMYMYILSSRREDCSIHVELAKDLWVLSLPIRCSLLNDGEGGRGSLFFFKKKK